MSEDNNSATSSWSAANSGAIAFKIDASPPTNVGISSITADSTSTLTITGLTATDTDSGLHATPYYFENTTDVLLADDTTPPTQVLGLAHSSNTTASITWGWTAAADAVSYNVYNASNDALIGNSLTNSYTQSPLSANTTYSVYVRAVNANGEGMKSSTTSTYTSANTPVSPSHSGNTVLTITWTWATGGAQKDYYASNLSPASNSGWIIGTSWNQSSLSANTQYTFKIKAKNGEDIETAFSSTASLYTSTGNTPTNFSAQTIGATSNTLTVDSFANDNISQAGYLFTNTATSNTSGWIQTNLSHRNLNIGQET